MRIEGFEAENISVLDSSGNYTSTEVEGVLQEIAGSTVALGGTFVPYTGAGGNVNLGTHTMQGLSYLANPQFTTPPASGHYYAGLGPDFGILTWIENADGDLDRWRLTDFGVPTSYDLTKVQASKYYIGESTGIQITSDSNGVYIPTNTYTLGYSSATKVYTDEIYAPIIHNTTTYWSSPSRSYSVYNGATMYFYVNGDLMQTWYSESTDMYSEASEYILTEESEYIQWE